VHHLKVFLLLAGTRKAE